jgi:RNA polymerase-binding transcription factor DksA
VKPPSPLPRAASWTQRHSTPLAARLPTLRATLEQERAFRRDQLARLDPHEGARSAVDPPVDGCQEAASALREVDALIAAGARRALDDIELAMARMHAGRYGYCRTCGLGIPLVVLEAIPKDHVVPGLSGTDRTTERPSPERHALTSIAVTHHRRRCGEDHSAADHRRGMIAPVGGWVWVPRTVSPSLISAVVAGRPHRHRPEAAQHDRLLWPSDSST